LLKAIVEIVHHMMEVCGVLQVQEVTAVPKN